MIKYKAELVLDSVLTPIVFETEGDPIEFLWTRYGMDTYIATLDKIEEE